MENHDDKYWLERFDRDAKRLDENRKLGLQTTYLKYSVPLTEEEARFFLTANPNLDTDTLVKFSLIERKVAEAYAIGIGEKGVKDRREQFLKDFREILGGFYTDRELDEITSHLDKEGRSDFIPILYLVGLNHCIVRRIRNAYLPEITDLCRTNRILFDGREEACDEIDRITGIKR